MGEIVIEGIHLHAYHGCLEEEAVIGGSYVVNIRLETDLSKAMDTDDLKYTIDYVEVYKLVKEEMAIRSQLIEHVAQRILNRLRSNFVHLKKAQVQVIKKNPPMNGNVEQVSVVLNSKW